LTGEQFIPAQDGRDWWFHDRWFRLVRVTDAGNLERVSPKRERRDWSDPEGPADGVDFGACAAVSVDPA